jgi:hypothetical protein
MCVRAVMEEQTREAHSEVCARFALTLTFVDFQPEECIRLQGGCGDTYDDVRAKRVHTALIYDDDGGDDAKKF